jgi:hypothetical protein
MISFLSGSLSGAFALVRETNYLTNNILRVTERAPTCKV